MLPYVIIVRIHSILYPTAYTVLESDSMLTKFVFNNVESPLSQSLIAIAIVYFHVLYINRLVIKHRIANQITLLPGLLYAILVSLLPEYCLLSPYLISNTFVLIAISQIFKTYKRPKAADLLFNVGFFIGLSSLFVPNHIFLILVGLIGFFVLRSRKVVEIFQLLSGTLLVYVAFGGILFLKDLSILPEFAKISLVPKLGLFEIRGSALIKAAVAVGLSIFATLHYNKYTLKKSIQTQKKIDILYWFMMASLIIGFLFPQIIASQLLLLLIPLAMLLNLNFVSIRNILIQEIFHIGMLALLFALNFGLI